MTPKRIQRERTKGWRMPEGAVYVGRPTKWGNPFDVGGHDHQCAVDWFRWWLDGDLPAVWDDRHGPTIKAQISELRGKDLMCWCRLGHPCHADVLLEIANRRPPPLTLTETADAQPWAPTSSTRLL